MAGSTSRTASHQTGRRSLETYWDRSDRSVSSKSAKFRRSLRRRRRPFSGALRRRKQGTLLATAAGGSSHCRRRRLLGLRIEAGGREGSFHQISEFPAGYRRDSEAGSNPGRAPIWTKLCAAASLPGSPASSGSASPERRFLPRTDLPVLDPSLSARDGCSSCRFGREPNHPAEIAQKKKKTMTKFYLSKNTVAERFVSRFKSKETKDRIFTLMEWSLSLIGL